MLNYTIKLRTESFTNLNTTDAELLQCAEHLGAGRLMVLSVSNDLDQQRVIVG